MFFIIFSRASNVLFNFPFFLLLGLMFMEFRCLINLLFEISFVVSDFVLDISLVIFFIEKS